MDRAGAAPRAGSARWSSTPVGPTPAPDPPGSPTRTAPPSTSPSCSGVGADRGRGLLDRAHRRAAADRQRCWPASTPPARALSVDGGAGAAEAIMTTDSVPKMAAVPHRAGLDGRRHGQGRRHARARPGHDARGAHHRRRRRRRHARRRPARGHARDLRPDRLRRLHVHQRHRPAARVRGQSGITPDPRRARRGRHRRVRRPRPAAHRRRRGRDQGHPRSTSSNAATEDDAVDAARAVSRSNLLKCAIHGEDPNWGRILSAVGTTDAALRARRDRRRDQRRAGCAATAPRAATATLVDMSGREVTITIDLRVGDAAGDASGPTTSPPSTSTRTPPTPPDRRSHR